MTQQPPPNEGPTPPPGSSAPGPGGQPGWGTGPGTPGNPYGGPPPPPPPAQPKSRFGRGCLLGGCLGALLVVGAVIGIVVAVGNGSDKPSSPVSSGAPLTGSNNTDHPPAGDVTVAGCEINDAKFPVAHLEIRNNSSKASTYFVTVEFTDPAGTRLGEGVTSSSAVAPGQLVKTDTSAIVEVTGKVTCRVTRVDRVAS